MIKLIQFLTIISFAVCGCSSSRDYENLNKNTGVNNRNSNRQWSSSDDLQSQNIKGIILGKGFWMKYVPSRNAILVDYRRSASNGYIPEMVSLSDLDLPNTKINIDGYNKVRIPIKRLSNEDYYTPKLQKGGLGIKSNPYCGLGKNGFYFNGYSNVDSAKVIKRLISIDGKYKTEPTLYKSVRRIPTIAEQEAEIRKYEREENGGLSLGRLYNVKNINTGSVIESSMSSLQEAKKMANKLNASDGAGSYYVVVGTKY